MLLHDAHSETLCISNASHATYHAYLAYLICIRMCRHHLGHKQLHMAQTLVQILILILILCSNLRTINAMLLLIVMSCHVMSLLKVDISRPEPASPSTLASASPSVSEHPSSSSSSSVLMFKDHTKYVVGIKWSPDGAYLATVSHDKTVNLYKKRYFKRATVLFILCEMFLGQPVTLISLSYCHIY